LSFVPIEESEALTGTNINIAVCGLANTRYCKTFPKITAVNFYPRGPAGN